MDEKKYTDLARLSREASYELAALDAEKKNALLKTLSENILRGKDKIIKANKIDIANAEKNITDKSRLHVIIDRLILDEKKIDEIAESVKNVAALTDPVGSYVSAYEREDGLFIARVRCPIGVIFMIYEARPTVTIDAFSLCFKSGNAVILRGGKESLETNFALSICIKDALIENNISTDACVVIDDSDRQIMTHLLKQSRYIDMVIPRGGEDLINYTVEESKIPVVCHDKGVCHTYIECDADKNMAENVVINAKTQRTTVCNTLEGLIIHKDYPYIKELCMLLVENDIELRVDETLYSMLDKNEKIVLAKECDYGREYLDKIATVKIAENFDEAVTYINKYGSHHTDAIITESLRLSERFKKAVDSAVVMVNASTRLSDGGEFGLGAEIGISNQKLHSRGPMGLTDLTSVKYAVVGKGHVRK